MKEKDYMICQPQRRNSLQLKKILILQQGNVRNTGRSQPAPLFTAWFSFHVIVL